MILFYLIRTNPISYAKKIICGAHKLLSFVHKIKKSQLLGLYIKYFETHLLTVCYHQA